MIGNQCPLCSRGRLIGRDICLPFFRHIDFSTVAQSGCIKLCKSCAVVICSQFFSQEQLHFTTQEYRGSRQTDQPKKKDRHGTATTRTELQAFNISQMLQTPAPKILDIGCFDGRLLLHLSDLVRGGSFTGVDIMVDAGDEVMGERGITLSTDLKRALDGEYDLIIISHSISYFPDLPLLLSAFRSALACGGTLYIQMPDIVANPYYLLMGDQFFTFTPDCLIYLLTVHGFRALRLPVLMFPREAVVVATVGELNPRLVGDIGRRATDIESCLSFLQKKRHSSRNYETATAFGIFGTTANAAFVDESTSCLAKFFVDEDPRRSQGLFRGKEVRSLEKLTQQDRIYFPYDENLRQKILRRTKASLLPF